MKTRIENLEKRTSSASGAPETAILSFVSPGETPKEGWPCIVLRKQPNGESIQEEYASLADAVFAGVAVGVSEPEERADG